jgi:sulfur carrier protein
MRPPVIQVTVNGERREIAPGRTLEQLLAELAVKRAGTAVEVNEAVVPRSEYARTPLAEGDRIEIVTMFGGG